MNPKSWIFAWKLLVVVCFFLFFFVFKLSISWLFHLFSWTLKHRWSTNQFGGSDLWALNWRRGSSSQGIQGGEHKKMSLRLKRHFLRVFAQLTPSLLSENNHSSRSGSWWPESHHVHSTWLDQGLSSDPKWANPSNSSSGKLELKELRSQDQILKSPELKWGGNEGGGCHWGAVLLTSRQKARRQADAVMLLHKAELNLPLTPHTQTDPTHTKSPKCMSQTS